MVIHIQDAHCNYYAQRQIAEIVRFLSGHYGVRSVNLEGGKGSYDLTPLAGVTDKETRLKVSDYFLREGLINGVEYYAVNNPDKLSLWGIEDEELYFNNLKAYKDSLADRDEIHGVVDSISVALARLKERVYAPELLAFDGKSEEYEAGKISLRDYAAYCFDVATKARIDMSRFPEVKKLCKAMAVEGDIDFKRANSERDRLISRLHRILSRAEAEELVVKTVELKENKISTGDFHAYLICKAGAVNIEVGDYPILSRYLEYLIGYNSIHTLKVAEEIRYLEKALKYSLCAQEDERKLCDLSYGMKIVKSIFSITLARDEYDAYKAGRGDFRAARYADFITATEKRYGLTADSQEGIYRLDTYLDRMSRFYEYSFDRDKVFVKNLKVAREPLRKDAGTGSRTAIVITGGFHTENFCRLLRENNISYVSILPKFMNPEGYSAPYFNVLAGNKGGIIQALTSGVSTLAVLDVLSEMGRSSQKHAYARMAEALQVVGGGDTYHCVTADGAQVTFSPQPIDGTSVREEIEGIKFYVTTNSNKTANTGIDVSKINPEWIVGRSELGAVVDVRGIIQSRQMTKRKIAKDIAALYEKIFLGKIGADKASKTYFNKWFTKIRSRDESIFVYIRGGKLAGFINFTAERSALYSTMFWLGAESERSGIGTLLMDGWFAHLKKRGIRSAHWEYDPGTESFYDSYLKSRDIDFSKDKDGRYFATVVLGETGAIADRRKRPILPTAVLGAPWIRSAIGEKWFARYAVFVAPLLEVAFWSAPICFGYSSVIAMSVAGAVFTALHLLNLLGNKSPPDYRVTPLFILPAFAVSTLTVFAACVFNSPSLIIAMNIASHVLVNFWFIDRAWYAMRQPAIDESVYIGDLPFEARRIDLDRDGDLRARKKMIVEQIEDLGGSHRTVDGWTGASLWHLEDILMILKRLPEDQLRHIRRIQLVRRSRSLAFWTEGIAGHAIESEGAISVVLVASRSVFRWNIAHELGHIIMSRNRNVFNRLTKSWDFRYLGESRTYILEPLAEWLAAFSAATLLVYVPLYWIVLPWGSSAAGAVIAMAITAGCCSSISDTRYGMLGKLKKLLMGGHILHFDIALDHSPMLTLYSAVDDKEYAAEFFAAFLLFRRVMQKSTDFRTHAEIIRRGIFGKTDFEEDRAWRDDKVRGMREPFSGSLVLLPSIALHLLVMCYLSFGYDLFVISTIAVAVSYACAAYFGKIMKVYTSLPLALGGLGNIAGTLFATRQLVRQLGMSLARILYEVPRLVRVAIIFSIVSFCLRPPGCLESPAKQVFEYLKPYVQAVLDKTDQSAVGAQKPYEDQVLREISSPMTMDLTSMNMLIEVVSSDELNHAQPDYGVIFRRDYSVDVPYPRTKETLDNFKYASGAYRIAFYNNDGDVSHAISDADFLMMRGLRIRMRGLPQDAWTKVDIYLHRDGNLKPIGEFGTFSPVARKKSFWSRLPPDTVYAMEGYVTYYVNDIYNYRLSGGMSESHIAAELRSGGSLVAVVVSTRPILADSIEIIDARPIFCIECPYRPQGSTITVTPGGGFMGKFEPVAGAEPKVGDDGKLAGKLRHIDSGETLDLTTIGQKTARDGDSIKKFRDSMERLLVASDAVSSEKKTVNDTLDLFEKNAPDHIIFSDAGSKGFFGLGGKTFMVIDKELAKDDPIAFLHEVIEYLKHTTAGEDVIRKLEASLDDVGREWFASHEKKYKSQGRLAYFNANREHYIIRAFTRQVFGSLDLRLTGKIKDRQKKPAGFIGRYEELRGANGDPIRPVAVSSESGMLEGVIYNIATQETLDLSTIEQRPATLTEVELNVGRAEELINSLDSRTEEYQLLRNVYERFNNNRPANFIITDAGSRNFFAAVADDVIVIDKKLLAGDPIVVLNVMMEYVNHIHGQNFDLSQEVEHLLRYPMKDCEQFDKYSGLDGFKKHEERYFKQGPAFYGYFIRNRGRYLIRAFTRQVFKQRDYQFTLAIKVETTYNTAERLVPELVHRTRKAPTYVIEPVLSLDDLSQVTNYFRSTGRELHKDGHAIHAGVYISENVYAKSLDNLRREIDKMLPSFYRDVTTFDGKTFDRNLTRMVIRLTSEYGNTCNDERQSLKRFIAERLKALDARLSDGDINMIVETKIRFVDVCIGDKTRHLNDAINLFVDIAMAECDRYRKNSDGSPLPDGYCDEIPDSLRMRFMHLLRLSVINYNDILAGAYSKARSTDFNAILYIIFAGYVLRAVPINWEERRIAREAVLRSL